MGLDNKKILVLVGQIFVTLAMMIYYSIACIVKLFVPYTSRCKSIKGETALITGAGSGLGKSLSKKLAKLGTRVVCVDIDTKANEQTVKEVKEAGGDAFAFTCDLSKKEMIYQVADQIKEQVGQIDILVNNAGIVTGKKFLESSDAAIERTMNVNCMAHFWLGKCFLPHMIANDHGHVVTIASMAGQFGNAGLGDYCASKFGAVGFEESMRYELQSLRKYGVKTTCVCPFYINTGMFEGAQPELIPFLDQEYVTDKIIEAMLTDQRILFLPRLMYLIYFAKGFLPEQVCFFFAESIFKNNHTMTNFVGRAKKD